MLLEVKNLSVCYGIVKALEDVSFQINDREIVAMIGPNGAGKSTALKAISGVLDADEGQITHGEILYREQSIKGIRTHELVEKGISLVPEGRRLFGTMTVLENLEMGAFTITNDKGISLRERIETVIGLFPILKERYTQKAGTLSSGEQQMLAIGRALMLQPKLLLLDEPSLGLSPNYVEAVFERLSDINKRGISILLVEQNAQKALEVCHRGYVFDVGSIALEGDKDYLTRHEKIRSIYFGQSFPGRSF